MQLEQKGLTDWVIRGPMTPAAGRLFHWSIAMIHNWFGIHDGLAAAGRIPAISRNREHISVSEIVLLILCGATAAAVSGFVRLGIRFPGHSIVLSIIPMALGFALAPRKNSGFIMSAGAFGMAAAFSLSRMADYGSGAFVSLCLIGPVMDLAFTKFRNGWKLYAGLLLAGVGTNLLALTSRSASKLLGLDFASMRPFGTWWAEAAVTYTISGAIAGLIAAFCFFNLRKQRLNSEETPGMHS
jgi:hypothetical protein